MNFFHYAILLALPPLCIVSCINENRETLQSFSSFESFLQLILHGDQIDSTSPRKASLSVTVTFKCRDVINNLRQSHCADNSLVVMKTTWNTKSHSLG